MPDRSATNDLALKNTELMSPSAKRAMRSSSSGPFGADGGSGSSEVASWVTSARAAIRSSNRMRSRASGASGGGPSNLRSNRVR